MTRQFVRLFLCRFAMWYGLLVAPWPGFNSVYGRYFRVLGQLVFAHERGPRLIIFEPVPAASYRGLDTRVVLANRQQLDDRGMGPAKYLELDARGVGWVPTALTLALILSTPVSWQRRACALGWGLFATHGLILFSVAVYIWNNSAELSLLTLTPFWKPVAAGLEETLTTQLGAGFVAPVLIWILVTFRWPDFIAWREQGREMPSG